MFWVFGHNACGILALWPGLNTYLLHSTKQRPPCPARDTAPRRQCVSKQCPSALPETQAQLTHRPATGCRWWRPVPPLPCQGLSLVAPDCLGAGWPHSFLWLSSWFCKFFSWQKQGWGRGGKDHMALLCFTPHFSLILLNLEEGQVPNKRGNKVLHKG